MVKIHTRIHAISLSTAKYVSGWRYHCLVIRRSPMTQDYFEDWEMRSAISALTPWGDELGSVRDVAQAYVYLTSEDAKILLRALPNDHADWDVIELL